MIQISRKIQLYPNSKQVTCFKQACGVARLVYNWALAEWQRQYREDKEYLTFCRQFGVAVYEESLHKPTANKLDIQFNQIKKVDYPFVYDVPSCISQQAMKHLNTAFQRFFKGQSGFPQFKRKGRSKAVFHLTNTRFSVEGKKIKQLHRELHRREKGSHNRNKTKTKLSRLYYKIFCIRQDVLHKLTTQLISTYGLIAIEDLDVQGMLKNHKLAQAISDIGFYEFKRQLVYKAEWYQRTVLTADRFFPSSKRCSCCGYTRKELPLSIRAWTCESCGESHDRDVNAAKNILKFANTVLV